MRISEEDYAKMMLQKGQPPEPSPPKRTKYGSVMENCQGIKFQSKKEARYFRELQARVFAGEVKYFLRQVPFDLFGVKYRVDFMEVMADGRIRYVDCKGFRTATYKAKRKQVETIYPVKIIEA
jgi:hypothetical protein